MAAVAYTVGCKRSDLQVSSHSRRKQPFAIILHFFVFSKGEKMQSNCNTRHFEYVLDFMLQSGSKECLNTISLLPLMYAIAALPDSSNQKNFFEILIWLFLQGVRRIKSVSVFFPAFFFSICAISLYWFCTSISRSPSSLFSLLIIIYLFVCDPRQSVLVLWEVQANLKFSGMSHKWFFLFLFLLFLHDMLLMWGFPLHIVWETSITRARLSAIMFREHRLELRVEVCVLVQDEIQVNKKKKKKISPP